MSIRSFFFAISLLAAIAVARADPPNPFSTAPEPPAPTLEQLRPRLAALEKQVADGTLPADAENLALLRFKIEQAELAANALDSNIAVYPDQMLRYLDAALDRAQAIGAAKGDAVYPAATQVHERAYIAAADDSAQPYWVFLPKDYTPTKKYPLAVFLHGYDPYISKLEPWLPSADTWSIFTDRGFILVVPYGRRNSDFVNIGEDDTLEVTKLTRRLYSIDDARVYLMGASMGGYGVYAVGLHHPDIWAALSPMSARSDMYLWFKLTRATVPEWKRLQYDADDPRTLERNALHLPIFMQHGALDPIVDVANSRLLTADLKAMNYEVRYREIPDADHYIYWKPTSYEMAIDWAAKVRHVAPPARVVFATGTLENHRAYWADIDSFLDYSRIATIDAEIKADNVVNVSTKNVGSFTLEPPTARLKRGEPITLVVNGKAAGDKIPYGQPIHWSDPANASSAPDSFPGTKSIERPGQIKNCYRDPFLIVYGTMGQKTDQNGTVAPLTIDEFEARKFRTEWQRFADGLPPIVADKELTDAQRHRYNLILFGTRASNSIIGEIADRLPVELTPTGYRVGEKQMADVNLGVQLCYPSPFDTHRMIVVQSGVHWGNGLPLNHIYDLLPDWIVYDDTLDETDKTNHALAAGYFDGAWKLAPGAQDSALPGSARHDEPAVSTVPPAVSTGNVGF